jgi:hypothetical protein
MAEHDGRARPKSTTAQQCLTEQHGGAVAARRRSRTPGQQQNGGAVARRKSRTAEEQHSGAAWQSTEAEHGGTAEHVRARHHGITARWQSTTAKHKGRA